MSDPQTPEGDAASRPGFDPARFFEIARKVGHGRALGLEYRDSGDGWAELALPWKPELVGRPESGILASGAIVSLIDTASGEPAGTRAMLILGGLATIAFGVVLCARPGIGAITLALLFGLFNLIAGIWMLVQGIELRRTGKTMDSALPEKQPA